jgi:1,4-alpha-glucan branching enzyme
MSKLKLVRKPPQRRRCRFRLDAPAAQTVVVTGDFCGWSADGKPLRPGKDGAWEAIVLLAPGRYEYRFLVDGEWADDPACVERVPNGFGSENCVICVEAAPATADTQDVLDEPQAMAG